MSVHFIYRGNGGAKFMRPVHTREEYLSLRNGGEQRQLVERIRSGEEGANVTHNTVRQMLKNWRKQGLVTLTDDGRYRKS